MAEHGPEQLVAGFREMVPGLMQLKVELRKDAITALELLPTDLAAAMIVCALTGWKDGDPAFELSNALAGRVRAAEELFVKIQADGDENKLDKTNPVWNDINEWLEQS